MRELRKDPALGRWVIVATDRAERPYEFKRGEKPAETPCAYCCADPSAELEVRCVPSEDAIAEGHETIVECSQHDRPFDAMSEDEVVRLTDAYSAALDRHAQNPSVAYSLIYKNNAMSDRFGERFVKHARSEVVPLPCVPKRVAEELREASQWHAAHSQCLYCRMADEERSAGVRVIGENASFIAFCPFASHSPYETMILPRRHESDLRRMSATEKLDLARMLRDCLGRIRVHLNDGPYYLVVHSAPFEKGEATAKTAREYHWHIEIAPRTFYAAGFEWGGGVYINPILPENAARQLREAAWSP